MMNLTPNLPASDKRRLLLLEREAWRRRCRRNFGAWCVEALEPEGFTPAEHHKLLIRELELVIRGEIDRLMVFMPPGSAKSTYVSKLLPPFALAAWPGVKIIGASHTSGLAEKFSRDIHRYIRDNVGTLGYGLTTERADQWATTNGGEYVAAGVGMGIAGIRGDLAIIDDPVRSRADADSETYRDKVWAWFNADLARRMKPGGRIILMHTRWHEDDLAGRLMATQRDRWRVVSLPAEAGENDPLGRAPGEMLWGDDAYGYGAQLAEAKAELEASGATREWASLFQQNPRPADGSLFKTALIGAVDAAPAGGKTVRRWDLAATKDMGTRDPDWTVGVKLTRTAGDQFVVQDVVRLRGGPDEVEAAIVATAKRDGFGVTVGLPQDPGQAGKAQVLYLTRRLIGFSVESTPETGDKATRAAPVAAQVNVGNVSMIRAGWNAAFIDELAAFPSGSHDDQVDALSGAFAMVGGSTVALWERLAG